MIKVMISRKLLKYKEKEQRNAKKKNKEKKEGIGFIVKRRDTKTQQWKIEK